MAIISINDVRGCILKSIEQAAMNFEKWTRNYWVTDYGAEGLIQARVAENLFNLQKNNKNTFPLGCPDRDFGGKFPHKTFLFWWLLEQFWGGGTFGSR